MSANLIERLEAAEAGWPGLSLDVVIALDDGGDFPTAGNISVTTSLDAALALAERVLPGCRVMVERDHDGSGWACLRTQVGGKAIMTEGTTPALALCIAILKAKEAEA